MVGSSSLRRAKRPPTASFGARSGAPHAVTRRVFSVPALRAAFHFAFCEAGRVVLGIAATVIDADCEQVFLEHDEHLSFPGTSKTRNGGYRWTTPGVNFRPDFISTSAMACIPSGESLSTAPYMSPM
jgi:hypothetical protein